MPPRSRTLRCARGPRTVFAGLVGVVLGLAALIAGPAPAVATTHTQTSSCTDGSGVKWSAKAIWRGTTVQDGTTKAIVSYAGWTTKRSGKVPTDSWVRTYDGAGRLVRTLAWTGRFDYASGTAFMSRNPVNPPSAPGAAKVTVTLGVDGDGLSNCTVSFTQPPAEPVEPVARTCEPPTHPRPSCTGMPPGTTLRNLGDGDYMVTQPGAVLDGVHVRGDLLVAANGVVIKNSQIDGTLINEVGRTHYSFAVSDTTIGPAQGCITAPGVGESDFTATRVRVRGHDDGFRISGNNVRVVDSYARLCANADSHADGIQAYCPLATCSNLYFGHNTVDARNVDATFMINLNDPNLRHVEVADNLLAGGAYTIVTEWNGGPDWIIRDNLVVDGAWAYAPASAEDTCSSQTWSGNLIVSIDANYDVTSKVKALACVP